MLQSSFAYPHARPAPTLPTHTPEPRFTCINICLLTFNSKLIQTHTHSLICSHTHLLAHSFTYMLTHSLTHSLIPSLTYSLNQPSLIHPLVLSFTQSLTHSLLSIRQFYYSVACSLATHLQVASLRIFIEGAFLCDLSHLLSLMRKPVICMCSLISTIIAHSYPSIKLLSTITKISISS